MSHRCTHARWRDAPVSESQVGTRVESLSLQLCATKKITCQTESLDVFPLTGQTPVQGDFVHFVVSAQVKYIYFEQPPNSKDEHGWCKRAIQGSIKRMCAESARRRADFSGLKTPAAPQIICPVFWDYSQSKEMKWLLAQTVIDL